MNMEDLIREKVTQHLKPELLEIINESANHAGHSGDDGSGQTHFKLKIVSPAFDGLSRVQRHQMVYKAVDGLFEQGLHAFSMTTLSPAET